MKHLIILVSYNTVVLLHFHNRKKKKNLDHVLCCSSLSKFNIHHYPQCNLTADYSIRDSCVKANVASSKDGEGAAEVGDAHFPLTLLSKIFKLEVLRPNDTASSDITCILSIFGAQCGSTS